MSISRRAVLKAAAAATVSAAATPARNYIGKKTRLTISMWDFSWLKANHPGGAYQDLERRVAEAAERGYNTLRVDCFPSHMLERESRFTGDWRAGVNLPQWGQVAAPFTCNVRRKVAELAGYCRKHGVWLGLDSWDKAHMFGHGRAIESGDEERNFAHFAGNWVSALKMMREDGVLERAVWIAPMNEVPHYASRYLKSVAESRKKALDEGETVLVAGQKEDDIFRRMNHAIGAPLKDEVSREKIPLSYSSLGAERYGNRLTDVYDVVDVHFMPTVIADKEDEAAMARAMREQPQPWRFAQFEKGDLKEFSRAWDRACRANYGKMLERVRDYHRTALESLTLPSGKKLQAVITESFGPCFWPVHPDVNQEWYKRYNGDALRIVAGMEFTGSSLSNYAEPIFPILWDDADWHRTANYFFGMVHA